MLIDSHAHLSSQELFSEVDVLICRAQEQSVAYIINICTDALSLQNGLALARRHPNVFNAGATPPHTALEEGEANFALFENACSQFVAIGEIGLDYFYTQSPKQVQQELFIRYLQLALHKRLPVIIHCREAFSDLYAIIDKHYANDPSNKKGVIHCFTGTLEEAKEAINRGWLISFSGIITFKKSEALRAIVKTLPLESIIIETDSPYLAPVPYRGKKNEPAFAVEVARCIAEIKQIDIATVHAQTYRNTIRLFNLGL